MILLTHAYFLADDVREQQIMKPYPPLGILYLSAYLKEYGVEHQVFDTTFSTKKIFFNYILEEKPSIIAIYINLMTKLNVLEIIRFIKTNVELQTTQIVLGGPDVKYNAENLLNFGADYLVIGEGEETFLELVNRINLNISQPILSNSFDDIDGLVYKDESGKICNNRERSLRKSLESLPIPNREAIDLNLYLDTWKKHHGENSITISTMRGCPYTCHWCSRGVYGLSYRRNSAEKVVEEIKFLKQHYDFDRLWFVDDVFTISYKWLQNFIQLLDSQQIVISYECITRADRLNEDVINLLKKSGCFRVWIGAESGSQKIIDLMDRRVKVEQVQEMIQLSRKAGIEAGTFIMLGYPEETEQDIRQTLQHLKNANPSQFTITVTYPIKGTELYEEVEAVSTTKQLNWSESTDRDIDFKRTYSRKYYQYAMQWIVNEMAFFQRKEKKYTLVQSTKLKLKSIKAEIGMYLNK